MYGIYKILFGVLRMWSRLFSNVNLLRKTHGLRSYFSSAETRAVAINNFFPSFISTCIFSYVGYNYMGGKELIKAKIDNMNADTELKLSQASQNFKKKYALIIKYQ